MWRQIPRSRGRWARRPGTRNYPARRRHQLPLAPPPPNAPPPPLNVAERSSFELEESDDEPPVELTRPDELKSKPSPAEAPSEAERGVSFLNSKKATTPKGGRRARRAGPLPAHNRPRCALCGR